MDADHDRLCERIDQYPEEDFVLSVVSLHEQLMGCNAFVGRNLRTDVLQGYNLMNDLLGLYCPAHVLPFDAAAHAQFDQLRRRRVRIGTMDLRIAATALVEGLVVLTRNAKDFSKVPGLTFEDWTLP
jgi:tRNA(fMet)-specific endonuclease VapC